MEGLIRKLEFGPKGSVDDRNPGILFDHVQAFVEDLIRPSAGSVWAADIAKEAGSVRRQEDPEKELPLLPFQPPKLERIENDEPDWMSTQFIRRTNGLPQTMSSQELLAPKSGTRHQPHDGDFPPVAHQTVLPEAKTPGSPQSWKRDDLAVSSQYGMRIEHDLLPGSDLVLTDSSNFGDMNPWC